jgi:hypothetical protein
LLVALVLVAFPIGCGPEDDEGVAISVDGVAKPHYIADGDEICAEGNRELSAARKELAQRLRHSSEPAGAVLERAAEEDIVPIVENRIEELRALEPPPGDERRVARIYDAAERALDRIESQPRLAERADRVFARASRLASEYGFRECARRG